MGAINVEISDALEKRFRQAIFNKFGGKRGGVKNAIEEAIEDWIKKLEHSK